MGRTTEFDLFCKHSDATAKEVLELSEVELREALDMLNDETIAQATGKTREDVAQLSKAERKYALEQLPVNAILNKEKVIRQWRDRKGGGGGGGPEYETVKDRGVDNDEPDTNRDGLAFRLLCFAFLLAIPAAGAVAAAYLVPKLRDGNDDKSFAFPTASPTTSPQPTLMPTSTPIPTITPQPTNIASETPTKLPTATPSLRPTRAPTGAPTRSPQPTEEFSGGKLFAALVNFVGTEGVTVIDETSPGWLAVDWLVQEQLDEGTREVEYDDQLLQRFAVLVMDFAMMGNDLSNNRRRELVRTQKNQDTCLWGGISCTTLDGDDSQRVVTSIRWGQQGLQGTIPSEIGLLSHLEYFSAPENNLQGSLPEEIYTKLPNLKSLYLYKNRLTGSISDSIGNLYDIEDFHLSHNEITGTIPESFRSISAIRSLRYFNMYSNQLTGTIPSNLRWRKLFLLDLGRNQLTGTLPEDLGEKFVVLRHLALDHNQFTGPLPSSYINAGSGRIESLHLNDNQLTGEVPGDHLFLNKLVQYTLQHNNFEGDIDKNTCKVEVFHTGEMVEFKTDCDICSCKSIWCEGDYCF